MGILERVAENGDAPKKGCHLFSVGYEDAFARLKKTYLIDRFGRGGSAEKFVVGTFGSGKSHFLREFLEIAYNEGCVTSEVPLNKDIDFTHALTVYKEVSQELVTPGSDLMGIDGVLVASLERVRSLAGDPSLEGQLVDSWVAGIDQRNFKLGSFGRILKRALQSHLNNDAQTFESACRWLGGEVSNRALARDLDTTVVAKNEENLHAHRAMLSLFQFVKHAQFQGTVVGFDESEQGLSTDNRKIGRILSMLQSGINALSDLEDGAALVVYALTPDISEKMATFPALQSRVADPVMDKGFFDGVTLSPMIDLSRRAGQTDVLDVLMEMGDRLVDMLYEDSAGSIQTPIDDTKIQVRIIAREVRDLNIASGNRRIMAKAACALLVRLKNEGVLEIPNISAEIESLETQV